MNLIDLLIRWINDWLWLTTERVFGWWFVSAGCRWRWQAVAGDLGMAKSPARRTHCCKPVAACTHSTLFRHSMTAKQKQTNKQTRSENEVQIQSDQIIQFTSGWARVCAADIELRLSMNFVKNFCLRHTIKLDTDLILNMAQHSCTILTDPVLNNFISSRVCINSSDRLSITSLLLSILPS